MLIAYSRYTIFLILTTIFIFLLVSTIWAIFLDLAGSPQKVCRSALPLGILPTPFPADSGKTCAGTDAAERSSVCHVVCVASGYRHHALTIAQHRVLILDRALSHLFPTDT